jgi:hypothetical protein
MPDNTGFMIAGYSATVLVLIGYVISLIVRVRALSERSDAIDSAARR